MTVCPVCSWPGGFHDDTETSPHTHLRFVPGPEDGYNPPKAQPVKLCNCGQPIDSVGAEKCRNPRHSAADAPAGLVRSRVIEEPQR